MPLSSFCLILGTVCYVFGFPIVFQDDEFIAWQRRALSDGHVLRVIGCIFAALSVMTLRRQWQITADGEGWMVVATWIVFVKSIVVSWWPMKYVAFHSPFQDRFVDVPAFQFAVGSVLVLLGAAFTYFGILLPQ
jgi:hypothetical protein